MVATRPMSITHFPITTHWPVCYLCQVRAPSPPGNVSIHKTLTLMHTYIDHHHYRQYASGNHYCQAFTNLCNINILSWYTMVNCFLQKGTMHCWNICFYTASATKHFLWSMIPQSWSVISSKDSSRFWVPPLVHCLTWHCCCCWECWESNHWWNKLPRDIRKLILTSLSLSLWEWKNNLKWCGLLSQSVKFCWSLL